MKMSRKNNFKLKNCRCMANFNGICGIKNCKGEISRLRTNRKNSDEAAKQYNIAAESFEDYFGDYSDEDLEE